MTKKEEIKEIAEKGLGKLLESQGKKIKEAEVFVSSNDIDVVKVNYTSDLPCNGVEQPAYSEVKGCSVRLILKNGNYGFAAESSLGVDAVLNAGKKAMQTAYDSPFDFSLPQPREEKLMNPNYDPKLLHSRGQAAVDFGWKSLDGLIEVFKREGFKPEDKIVLNGDLTIIKEFMGIASTTGIKASEISTIMMAYLTTMIQKYEAKGTGWATGSFIDTFKPEDAGKRAAISALKVINGKRIKSGNYDVVLGPQAVTDLATHFLGPGVSAGAISFGYSPFIGGYGKQVVSPLLNVYDDGSIHGLAASKVYTCEGIPTKRTDLIKEGKLVDFLGCHSIASLWGIESEDPRIKDYQEKLKEFLGSSQIPKIGERNGFRFGAGGGRSHMGRPSISATNLFIEGTQTTNEAELVNGEKLGEGIYIGRLWYTYPIRQLSEGDVTSTVIADSYVIKNGRIAYPLKPNTVRLNDNFNRMFNNVVAVGDKQHGTIVWGSEEVVYAPHLLIKNVHLDNIAEFMG